MNVMVSRKTSRIFASLFWMWSVVVVSAYLFQFRNLIDPLKALLLGGA